MRAQIATILLVVSSFTVPVLAQTNSASSSTASQSSTASPAAPPAAKTPTQPRRAAAPESNNIASRDQILKLLELLQVPDSLAMTLDAMKEQMKDGAVQMFSEKVPHPSKDQINSVHAIVDEEFKKIGMDDLIEDVVPIYQKHLSRQDVEAVIRFYSSPVGQKIRKEQPAMARESLQATSAGQRGKMELLLAKLDLRIEQLIQDEEKKSAPKQ